MPLPILVDKTNRRRVDNDIAIPKHNIYRCLSGTSRTTTSFGEACVSSTRWITRAGFGSILPREASQLILKATPYDAPGDAIGGNSVIT